MTTTTVSGGQTSRGLLVGSGDALLVLSGGTALDTKVLHGGSETVSSSGLERTEADFSASVAGSATIEAGGNLDVARGGGGSIFSPSSGGTETVSAAAC